MQVAKKEETQMEGVVEKAKMKIMDLQASLNGITKKDAELQDKFGKVESKVSASLGREWLYEKSAFSGFCAFSKIRAF